MQCAVERSVSDGKGGKRKEKTHGVTGESEVGLEAHLVGLGERRERLTASHVRASTAEGNTSSIEQSLKEELSVERERRRVEGSGRVAGNDGVRTSDGVRGEEMDDLVGGEASIGKAREDGVDGVGRSGYGAVLSRGGRVRAPSEELELGCTRAVREADGSTKLDEVASSDVVILKERCEVLDTLGGTVVLGEVGLDVGEEDDRSVSTSTREFTREGEADAVMERQAERLVDFFTTLALEKGLQVIT